MNIQEMLGDAFHEGMTIEEINTALSGRKFADLSTGQYVDANKHKAEVEALNKTLAKKTSELNARLSDDEKAAASREADKAYIKQLLKNKLRVKPLVVTVIEQKPLQLT